MSLSRGELRELLVVQFAHAMLKSSRLSPPEDGLISLIKGHKFTSVIKDSCLIVEKRLNDNFHSITDNDDLSWLRKKLHSKILPLLYKMQNEKIELLSFAVYLLYVNFSDNREKVLSDKFLQFVDPQQYFYILDMIDTVRGTENNISDDMYDMAIYCIKELKGK